MAMGASGEYTRLMAATKTIELRTQIPASRRLVVMIPKDMPVGDARVFVEVTLEPRGRTLGDLAKSDVIGMWRDRDDIRDSREFARTLRETAWKRA